MTDERDGSEDDSDSQEPYQLPGEDRETARARMVLSPTVNGVIALQRLNALFTGKEADPNALIIELTAKLEAILNGDMTRPEGMLVTQFHTLDALFNVLIIRAIEHGGYNSGRADVLIKLALRAQNQSRASIETLARMKNPQPTLFAHQANITTGPQQINNHSAAQTSDAVVEPNKLLEQTDGERLDPGAASKAVGGDSPMEAVGTFNRSEKQGR